jgi:hypothetical protein
MAPSWGEGGALAIRSAGFVQLIDAQNRPSDLCAHFRSPLRSASFTVAVHSVQLFNFAPALFPVSLTGKRLLDPQLLARLQVKRMPLDLFNDVFLLHLALESPEGVFQSFTVLESYFCQTYDTSKPTKD